MGRARCRGLDHPFDHPDDPTRPVWIRLDRRGIQCEQARSVWSRPDRRRAPGYGSGGWGFESLAARQTCRSEGIKQENLNSADLAVAVLEPPRRLITQPANRLTTHSPGSGAATVGHSEVEQVVGVGKQVPEPGAGNRSERRSEPKPSRTWATARHTCWTASRRCRGSAGPRTAESTGRGSWTGSRRRPAVGRLREPPGAEGGHELPATAIPGARVMVLDGHAYLAIRTDPAMVAAAIRQFVLA
jgi:hypothetical protein